jgi:hypothetical protein
MKVEFDEALPNSTANGCVASSYFLNTIELLKVMFMTLHASSKLKSLDYGAIIIEFMNCFPKKINGDILFELLLVCHLLGHSEQLQGMDRK